MIPKASLLEFSLLHGIHQMGILNGLLSFYTSSECVEEPLGLLDRDSQPLSSFHGTFARTSRLSQCEGESDQLRRRCLLSAVLVELQPVKISLYAE